MRFMAALALFVVSLGLETRAQGETELRVLLPKGARRTVTQTIDVQDESIDLKGKSQGRSPKDDFKLTEKWTDEGVEDEAGKSLKSQRTYTISKWAIGPEKPAVTGLEAAVLAFERAGQKVDATTGKPDAESLEALRKSPAEAVELLLPEAAVKTGSTWEIPGDKVSQLLDSLQASTWSLTGKGAENAETSYTQVLNSGIRSFSKTLPLKGKVQGIKGTEVTLEIEGRGEFVNESSAEVQGKKPDLPKHVVTMKGTLKFNSTTGSPVSLDLMLVQVIYDGARVTMKGKDLEVSGLRNVWKFTRAYAAAK